LANQYPFKSFREVFPEMSEQWHPSRNGAITPDMVPAKGPFKAWWVCPQGHEYFSTCNNRAKGKQCGVCTNRVVVAGINDLASQTPELLAEWDYEINSINPENSYWRSTEVVSWKCQDGHAPWFSQIRKRVDGHGCPSCSGRVPIRGVNDLETLCPNLAKEFDLGANAPALPYEFNARSNKAVFWQCPKNINHKYKTQINSRYSGTGCPFCAGKRTLIGDNDLATLRPELAEIWSKKNGFSPNEVTIGSSKTVWWNDRCGHEYPQPINAKSLRSFGCPICSNHRILIGYNDLATTHPDLASQLIVSADFPLTPQELSAGSAKKVLWRCENNHEWEQSPVVRISGNNCPYCGHQRLLPGWNDLATLNPELASEWDYQKNSKLPTEFFRNSQERVWWLCEKGHSWDAIISIRQYSGCPTCAPSGFDKTSDAVVYFITNPKISASKIGIANASSQRISRWQRLGWTLIHMEEFSKGTDAVELESIMFDWIRGELGLGVALGPTETAGSGGWTETFSPDGVPQQEVVEMLKMKALKLRAQN
jgi:hypothetical protein